MAVIMELFVPFLRQLIRVGQLTVVDAAGRSHVFEGQPIPELRPVTVRLHDPRMHWRLPLQPSIVAGEGYMDGSFTVENGTIYDFLALAGENIRLRDGQFPALDYCGHLVRRLQQWNPLPISRRNAALHYDLSAAFYDLFLDADRQYSCAYFRHPQATLEEAQLAKKRHIMSKLLLQPGQKVLDIGCGWGGLALTLARDAGVHVTGITLSEEQLKAARQRAEDAQLGHRLRFLLADYREVTGRFDRIVSVGMFEHVGVNHYRTFFCRVKDLLSEKGVALLSAIGRSDGPGTTNAWVRKYIFPGGYSPALSEVLSAVEKSGLFVGDIEILRHHYAQTLRHWRSRFAQHRTQAAALYDESFCRMWDFYLAGAEMAFRHQNHMVWQMQISRRPDTLPMTRDYMALAEAR